ncbi:major facilitator superfamily domain-containing protein 6 [soil metagenome]
MKRGGKPGLRRRRGLLSEAMNSEIATTRTTAGPRMALQYVLLFAGNGVALPFIGLWLRAQGLSGTEIGALLAAPMLGRLLTGPAIALWADGFRLRRTAIAILALTTAAAYAAMLVVEGVWAWAALWFVAATAFAAIIPLSDVMTLRIARREGFSFSVPRGWGSVAFVGASVAMGALLVGASVDWVLGSTVGAALLMAGVARWVLPAEPVNDGPPEPGWARFAGLGRLVRDGRFMTAILAVGCVQATHAFYYGFATLAWKAQGLSEGTAGQLWAVAVVVEIALMWWVEPWRRRRGIGPWTVLGIGAGAAVARWSALAFAPPLWMLWPLQGLHALTFAATYLAGVQLVERLSPPGAHTSAQTLSSMLSAGVLIGLATVSSGPLYDAVGVRGYLAMSGLAALGGMIGLVGAWRSRGPLAVRQIG